MEKIGMKRNKKIAITGGIGSGKSTVAKLIENAGYRVFSCDEIARRILSCESVAESIATFFPDCIFDGKIDRKKLATIVFNDPEQLKRLESITHPIIMRELLAKMEIAEGRFIFAEVPLLFEGGYESLFDGVIVVLRNERDRIDSVCLRDGLTQKEIVDRMKNQFDYENKVIFEHTVLYNDGDLANLREKVGDVLEKITNG